MSSLEFFALVGLVLWLLGLEGLFLAGSMLRRVVAINVMSSGVFMIMVALAARSDDPDPVLQALVVTGLVVGVSATALAVRLYRVLRSSEQTEQGRR